MDALFILVQRIVPQHLLSRLAGWLADLESPIGLKNWVVGWFIGHFNVDMAEAAEPDHRNYRSFNAFFTRALREGARPVADAALVSPADGAISQCGDIVDGCLLQAKGRHFSALELLGGDRERAAQFAGGSFATIYLSPRDYHRVHMPVDGELTATTYIPGDLFSVNAVTAEGVGNLFARNERLVCYFDTPLGPMAMVLVGAMIVAGIETVWAGQVAPQKRGQLSVDFRQPPAPVKLAKGDEMGRFKLGSTVILLLPNGAAKFDDGIGPGSVIRMGEALAQ